MSTLTRDGIEAKMAFVDSEGVRLYWEEHGAGEPLLMIPGFGCSVEIYGSNTPALAERFRVIVFDPRGAGRSDSPDDASGGGYTMERYATDCAAVLDAAGCESAHVLGTSFGGMVAMNLALAYPQRVRGLVLACTTPGGAAHVLPPAENLATFMAASLVPDPVESTRMRYPLHYSDAYIATHDAEIIARSLATAHMRPTEAGRAGQIAAVGTHDVSTQLQEIATPTLVAHGSDDGVIPAANARTLASAIPDATLRIYEGAKHIFFVERAEEFNADVIAFLSGD
jgi:pimeloyl-ACP methyl ester carboxylesterase